MARFRSVSATRTPGECNHRPGAPGELNGAEAVTFAAALRVWARIGFLSFGGPAGQIALMHRELVERHRWISEARFLHALNYCMLLPGPEAQQLATYVGWLLHRTRGGIVAGALFVLPGFVAMLLLSWLYVRYQNAHAMTALFFGLKAAVLAVVIQAVLRIGRRALQSRLMIGIACAAFLGIFVFRIPFPWIVVIAAGSGFLARHLLPSQFPTVPAKEGDDNVAYQLPSVSRALKVALVCLVSWFAPVAIIALWLGKAHVLVQEGVVFSQSAVVTFGGAYAVLSYMAQRAVEELHWLQPGEMIDGLALAETTPGPLIMVLQFVGFIAAYRYPGALDPWLAAVLGASLTTWVTFLPSFLFIFLGAPYMESLRHHRGLNAALSSVTAAVVGVILNLSVWFALHTIFGQVRTLTLGPMHVDAPVWSTVQPASLFLSIVALIAMLRFRVGMGPALIGCAVVGAGFVLVRG